MKKQKNNLLKLVRELKTKPGKSGSLIGETELVKEIFDLLGAGYFIYYNNTHQIELSDSLYTITRDWFNKRKTHLSEFLDQIFPEDRNLFSGILNNSNATEKKISGVFRFIQKLKDYTKYFMLSGKNIRDSSGDYIFIGAVQEITKEIKQNRDYQRNYERVAESDQIKTRFLSVISQNIRSPMNTILGFAELMNLTDLDAEKKKEFIQTIKRQGKKLLQLIDDIIEIEKFESGEHIFLKVPCKLHALLTQVSDDIKRLEYQTGKEHIEIKTFFSAKKEIEFYTDPGRIQQVIFNLAGFCLRNLERGNIQIGYMLPDQGKIQFFVKDSGHGFNREELKNIFDWPALSEKEKTIKVNDDSGLGLFISKRIVKVLGGKIGVVSELNQGTEFQFFVPFKPVETNQIMEDLDDEIAKNKVYNWRGKVILIVEDEEVNGLFLEAVLQETGAQTLFAKNGFQALELFKSINKIDLILMDIIMPVMNGIKTTLEIRKINQNIPIIAQTALASHDDKKQCLRAGCNDSITKPIDIEELLKLVNKYLIK